MWAEALQMLARAERLHRDVFSPSGHTAVSWEPPVDVLETEDAVLVLAALPGVDSKQVQLVIRDGVLLIAGARVLPRELRTAVIHRIELPQGRFERQVRLPAGTYEQPVSAVADGCLIVKLPKVGRKGAA
ncbi:MAG: Hsp20/alpha crystallin family protein [Proteobacteria bacterium]|nr:Hsp20/alpha crystallin family protein [Pseudomonadota bacterium]